MTLRTYPDLLQGSDDWLEARRGIVTASVAGEIVTPKKVQPASNVHSRAIAARLVAERITGWVEPEYVGHDQLRGSLDEPVARGVYAEHYAPVTEMGLMVRDDWGYRIGYSPDGLVGDEGQVEIKSRRPKAHLAHIIAGDVPAEDMAQIQCGLLVSGRHWCDYVSFAGGMPMWHKRVEPDRRWFDAILDAVQAFEEAATEMVAKYEAAVAGLPMTERRTYDMEIVI